MEEIKQVIAKMKDDIEYHKVQLEKNEIRLEIANEALTSIKAKELNHLLETAEFDVRYHSKLITQHRNSIENMQKALNVIEANILVN